MRFRLLWIITLVSLLPQWGAGAQSPSKSLAWFIPVSGQISDKTPSEVWTFDAVADQRVGLRMQAASGDLVPAFQVADEAGTIVAKSQPGALGNAVIDLLRIPKAGHYQVQTQRAAGSGDYRLTMLPAYSALLLSDGMGIGSPTRLWRDTRAAADYSGGKLRLSLQGANRVIGTSVDALGLYADLYIQADIEPDTETLSPDSQAGLAIRASQRGRYLDGYQLLVNNLNQWAFVYSDAVGTTYIQQWTPLPADVVTRRFTLGLLAQGNQFTVFYNGVPQLTLQDSRSTAKGEFGMVLGNGQTPNNAAAMLFDNLRVTLPAPSDAADVTIPATLTHWQDSAADILDELRSARIVPFSGRPDFTTPLAYVTNSTPSGIVLIPLAQSQQFSDLVYAAEFGWNANSEDVACALELRMVDDGNFAIVYADRKGGYGFRQMLNGDSSPTVYDLSTAVRTGENDTNRLLVIAVGNRLVTYINGQRVIDAHVIQRAGSVAIAAYNYKVAQNYCQFRNVWLRIYDGQ